MKRKLLMVAFALLFSVSAISNSQEIRKKDLKIVEKVYYLKDSDTPFTGKVSEGKDRLYYLNGKQDGKWISFYKNGNIKSIINWKDGKLNGKYIIYENNGMKSTETVYKDGKENGYYYLYNTNGTYRTKGAYVMGKPVGEWEYYDKNGKLKDKVIAN